jgi:hypothetical protein
MTQDGRGHPSLARPDPGGLCGCEKEDGSCGAVRAADHGRPSRTFRPGLRQKNRELAHREVPEIYLDFKKALALPTRQVYEGLRVKGIPRLAVVPPIFLHDALHRFYGYLSRVAVPLVPAVAKANGEDAK